MPCVFCGARATSAEHIWPQWIGRLFDLPERTVPYERTRTTGPNPPSFEAPPFSLTVNRVCRECNNGWMSDLEGAAKPFVERMIVGDVCDLSEAAQRTVATWCFKTAAMFQFTHPDNVSIPPEHYRHLYERREPPPLCDVHLARYATRLPDGNVHIERAAHYQHHAIEASTESGGLVRGFGATLSIGQFVFQLFGLHGDRAEPFEHGCTPGFVVGIWPARRAVRWPTRFALNEDALDRFGREYLSPS
jgi:hypothetical protein